MRGDAEDAGCARERTFFSSPSAIPEKREMSEGSRKMPASRLHFCLRCSLRSPRLSCILPVAAPPPACPAASQFSAPSFLDSHVVLAGTSALHWPIPASCDAGYFPAAAWRGLHSRPRWRSGDGIASPPPPWAHFFRPAEHARPPKSPDAGRRLRWTLHCPERACGKSAGADCAAVPGRDATLARGLAFLAEPAGAGCGRWASAGRSGRLSHTPKRTHN